VEGLAFPQYKERYLNLALVLTGVCGLAMDNAQAYRAVLDTQASLRTANEELSRTIDELHRTQQQLVEKEKMAALGALVAGVAHEVNTPAGVGMTLVSSLAGKTRALAALFEGKTMKYSDLQKYLAAQDEGLGLLRANLQRIGELVNSFKRVSTDHAMDRRRSFAVKDYIQTVVNALDSCLRPAAGQLRLDCPDELALDSYPGAFAQVLVNLVSNSMLHGFRDGCAGHIDISLTTRGRMLRLDYRDDGQGMQAQTLEKMFDPFFTTDRQNHTGLGMHILYNLVTQKFGGSVQCESRPGRGVHFVVLLPVTPP
jgi:signal transduction histidine kinase